MMSTDLPEVKVLEPAQATDGRRQHREAAAHAAVSAAGLARGGAVILTAMAAMAAGLLCKSPRSCSQWHSTPAQDGSAALG
jgi:hypothetical protein